MSEISKSFRGDNAASFTLEALRLRRLARDSAQPWMREALDRLAEGYEQLAALEAVDAPASCAE